MQIVATILALLFATLAAVFFFAGYPEAFKAIWDYFKDPALATFATFLLALFTAALALATFRVASLTEEAARDTKESLKLARQGNERAEKLFTGQNQPLIDVTPITIKQVYVSGDTQAVTLFSIANYSGFKAHDIAIDLKYG